MLIVLLIDDDNIDQLFNWLHYMASFHDTSISMIAICGCSRESNHKKAKQTIQTVHPTMVMYKLSENSNLDECLLSVLVRREDEFVCVLTTHEFPIHEQLNQCLHFLQANPDYLMATGPRVMFDLNETHPSPVLMHAISINSEDCIDRANTFSALPYKSSLAVMRKNHLITRLKKISNFRVAILDEIIEGLVDSFFGKIKAIDEVTFIILKDKIGKTTSSRFESMCFEGKKILELRSLYMQCITDLSKHQLSDAARVAGDLLKKTIVGYWGFSTEQPAYIYNKTYKLTYAPESQLNKYNAIFKQEGEYGVLSDEIAMILNGQSINSRGG